MTVRLRIRFTKLGKVRFTSHRDVARMWERAFRRASLPIAYSEGFSPRPRLSFGLALSTGHESLGEYLDADLAPGNDVDLDALPERLSAGLPVGIDVVALAPLVARVPSLQADVTACRWVLALDGVEPGAAAAAVEGAFAASELPTITRRKGEDVLADVRPGVLAITLADPWPLGPDDAPPGALVVAAALATQPHGVRPADLVAAVFPGAHERRVVRTHQWIDHDGARREPIEAPDATSPRTRLVRT